MAALFSQLLSIWANVCDKNEIENSAVDKTSEINTSVNYALNVEEKHNIQNDWIEKQSVISDKVNVVFVMRRWAQFCVWSAHVLPPQTRLSKCKLNGDP